MTQFANRFFAAVFALFVICGVGFAPGALAAKAKSSADASAESQTEKPAKKSKKAKKSSGKTTFNSGSEESRKERSARLGRECKGQVNAGACAGYTR